MNKVVCPNCGKPTAIARELAEYHYQESGLRNVWLIGGVTETRCPECGSVFTAIWKESQLIQVITMDLLMEPTSLTGPQLRFIRRSCELSQGELAALLGCPRRATIADREGREDPKLSFPEATGLRLILLRAFQRYLETPGNNFLEPSQLKKLWSFADFFDPLATKMVSGHKHHRIRVAVQRDLWTVEQKLAA